MLYTITHNLQFNHLEYTTSQHYFCEPINKNFWQTTSYCLTLFVFKNLHITKIKWGSYPGNLSLSLPGTCPHLGSSKLFKILFYALVYLG